MFFLLFALLTGKHNEAPQRAASAYVMTFRKNDRSSTTMNLCSWAKSN
jgi:hypothetical protein